MGKHINLTGKKFARLYVTGNFFLTKCGEEVRGEDVPSTHPWCHSCGARMEKEDEHEAG